MIVRNGYKNEMSGKNTWNHLVIFVVVFLEGGCSKKLITIFLFMKQDKDSVAKK